MKLRWFFYGVLTIFGGIVLFGSLIWSAFSDKAIYFVVGYPIAVFLLFMAYATRPLDDFR